MERGAWRGLGLGKEEGGVDAAEGEVVRGHKVGLEGAAFAHNFGLAGNADAMNEAKEIVVGGISTNGKIAVCLGIVIMLAVSLWNMPKRAAVNAAAVK